MIDLFMDVRLLIGNERQWLFAPWFLVNPLDFLTLLSAKFAQLGNGTHLSIEKSVPDKHLIPFNFFTIDYKYSMWV